MTFCPLCETVHGIDEPCSIRGIAAVKGKFFGGSYKGGFKIKQDPVAQTEERSHPKRQAEGSSPSGVANPASSSGRTPHFDCGNPRSSRGARTKPSKDELRAIIAQLESEKAERRKRKAATQKRWRYKRAGKDV